ncbi:MAG: PrsW family intramembrane metalloprotease [Paludibacteraceae bacterium]|nr:PrsW family intramembrane metalloprotease [Paludibacteraceae bacterium]MBQ2190562.1 PrsW family intramembrane metalloprotease [Paludibacteraceae bacterium]MBQ2520898.1 PrsW family intramembrane metalloprotease [Paludibacteraceae bacterium]
MKYVLMLLLAVLPALLLGLYIWLRDPKKEPVLQLLKAAGMGMAVCIPVAFIEVGISWLLFGFDGSPTTLIGTTTQAFFVAALPEELAKLFVVWVVLYKNPYFDEHFDGIVYAVFVGLGFALVENISYIFQNEETWLTVGIGRALLSVPGHYAFAVIMGYFYSVYHFVNHSKSIAACILLVPFVVHGIYDALAMSGAVSPVVGGLSFLVLIYFCIKLHAVAESRLKALIDKDRQTTKNDFL